MAEASGTGFPSILFTLGSHLDTGDAAPAYFADLNLDQVVAAVTTGRSGYQLEPFLYSPLREPEGIAYRQEVFRDLEDAGLRALLTTFGSRMQAMRERLAVMHKLHHPYQQQPLFLDVVADYIGAVTGLAVDLEKATLRSGALRTTRDALRTHVNEPAFRALVEETDAVRSALGEITYTIQIRGSRVTVRRYEGEADYGAEVLATFEKFRQGVPKDYQVGFRESLQMTQVEERILERVALLFPDAFGALRAYAAHHVDFLDERIARLDRELQFYLGYLAYTDPLRATGLPFCYPKVTRAPKEVRVMRTFDLPLAAKLTEGNGNVVCNDVTLEGPERVLVVSGPNQGGKTTFARLFGQLHHLACLGVPVPGTDATLHLFDQLFTHFGRAEELGDLRGKLEDDLVRIREILSSATGDSVVVLNEVFGSTSLEDARFLGRRMLERILELDLLCVCVTFVDELSRLGEATVSMVSTVEPTDPARRTFEVVRRPADGLAYALAIAERHGVTYKRLRDRLSR
ncbi:MAG: DNA mismatch repair protein MutS [Actinomycetota bacterium]|nr:DNA mismatch repair protein MutS [Actinomycetota bacterium]